MEQGDNLPDDFVNQIIEQRFKKSDYQALGLCLEGYPRTESQYNFLRKQLKMQPDIVLMIDFPDEVIATGYKDQRVDPNTGRVYSARSMKYINDSKVQKRL